MIIKRGGQYRSIDASEYGIWLAAGYTKVTDGNIGDNIPKDEIKEELPDLTLEEIHETDKFVKLDEAKESVAVPHGESEVIPELDEEGCYGGVCGNNLDVTEEKNEVEIEEVIPEITEEFTEVTEHKSKNSRRNKTNK